MVSLDARRCLYDVSFKMNKSAKIQAFHAGKITIKNYTTDKTARSSTSVRRKIELPVTIVNSF